MRTYNIFLAICLFFICVSCENESVDAPIAKFELQSYNLVESAWETMEKPYTIVLSAKKKIRIVSANLSEYNSFYSGDSVKSGNKYIKHIYRQQPHKDYQGIPLVVDLELKKGVADIIYEKAGNYGVTFVATNIGLNNKQITAVVNDSIFVKN